MLNNRFAPRLAPRLACGVAAAALLAGCATTEVVTQSDSALKRAEALNEVAARPMAPADVSPVKVRSDVYVGADVYHNEHGDPLPARWERQNLTFAKSQLVTFQEVANMVSVVTRIPVATTTGAVSAAATGQGGGFQAQAAPIQQAQPGRNGRGGGGGAGEVGGPGIAGLINPQGPGGNDVAAATNAIIGGGGLSAQPIVPVNLPEAETGELGIRGKMRVAYTGSLRGFLDLIGTNFNVGWEYSEGRILFERTVVRTFEIPTLPILSKQDFKMTSGSTTSGGSGGGVSGTSNDGQTASTETAYDPISEIKAGLEAVVGESKAEDGKASGTYRYNTTTGQVTVVAPPQTMKRVAGYIKTLNASLSKQIAMNVKVYSVVLTDGDNYSSNLNVLFQQAGKYGLSYGTGGVIPAIGGAAASQATGGGNIGWAILNQNSQFAGTNGIVQALSSRGDVSVVTSASVVTVNGVPVPLQVANTRGYAAQVSVTQGTSTTGLGGVASTPTSSITPGSVTTGFNLHLLPKVRSDGQLLLQYGMNISQLVGANNGFDVFNGVGGSSIQLPNVNQRNFIQEAILPNGSTLVLTGFEQVTSNSQKSGPISPSLFPLGGANLSNVSREVLVITITPTLLDASVAANPPGVR